MSPCGPFFGEVNAASVFARPRKKGDVVEVGELSGEVVGSENVAFAGDRWEESELADIDREAMGTVRLLRSANPS